MNKLTSELVGCSGGACIDSQSGNKARPSRAAGWLFTKMLPRLARRCNVRSLYSYLGLKLSIHKLNKRGTSALARGEGQQRPKKAARAVWLQWSDPSESFSADITYLYRNGTLANASSAHDDEMVSARGLSSSIFVGAIGAEIPALL